MKRCLGSLWGVVRLAVILFVLLPAGCVNDKEEPEWTLGPGDPLPEFSVVTNSGERVSRESFAGRGGVIVFFNTDCPDCRREFPILQKEYESRPDGEVWVCIAREEGEEQIADYWSREGLTMPYSAQSDRKVYNLFASVGIPRVYRVSGEMVIM